MIVLAANWQEVELVAPGKSLIIKGFTTKGWGLLGVGFSGSGLQGMRDNTHNCVTEEPGLAGGPHTRGA
jgi:hypothetical protein